MSQYLILDGKQYVFKNLKRYRKPKKPYVYADIKYSVSCRDGHANKMDVFTFEFKYISPRLKYRIERGEDIRIALNCKYFNTNVSGSKYKKFLGHGKRLPYAGARFRPSKSSTYNSRRGNKYKTYHVSKASYNGSHNNTNDPIIITKDLLNNNKISNRILSIYTGTGNKITRRFGSDLNRPKLEHLIYEPVLVESPSGRVLKTYSEKI